MTILSSLPQATVDREFVLSRLFAAPRALVFTCWTDPAHLGRWWGPRGFTCPVCEVDFRVGGSYRLVMRDKDGTDFPIDGRYLEIEPGRRIVQSDDTSGHPESWLDAVDPDRKGQGPRSIELQTTISFDDDVGGTRVTIRTRFESRAMRDRFMAIGMQEGWSSSLDKLDELALALKGDPREINIVRVIDAPIHRVFAAFSDPAGMATWWGPNGFTTTTRSMEFRVGGVWDYTMHGPDGTDYPNYVTYTAIESGRLIAYDHGTDASHPATFKAAITFAPDGKGTRVRLRLMLADAKERPGYVAFGAVEGGYQNLERLAAYLAAGIASSSDPEGQ
jgi:uncharacterized protein YndB with AHSA1/START domain